MRTKLTTLLAVIGAATVLVLAGNTIALATTGKALIQGRVNKSPLTTTIQRTKPGPAASFRTTSGAPFAVTSTGKVARLNADLIDGKDSGAFATNQRTAVAQRLIGFGQFYSTLQPGSVLPGTVSKTGIGQYSIKLPGYAPGCVRPAPLVFTSASFAAVFAVSPGSSTVCASGDTSITVMTYDKTGALTDSGFNFTMFSGSAASASRTAARRAGTPTTCTRTTDRYTCR